MQSDISILWSVDTINTINNTVKYLSSVNLGKSINILLNRYIEHFGDNKPYTLLGFKINPKINTKSLKFAHACEINIKRYRKKNTAMSDILIFKSISRIIYDMIDLSFKYNKWELNYQEEYLINLISETFNQSNKEIIKSAYYITLKTIDIDIDENILDHTETLYLYASDIDLSFLKIEQIRNIMKILHINRKIYLRVFLVIVNYLCHEDNILTKKLIINKSKNTSFESFKKYTKDIMLELLIVLASIKNE